MKLKASNEKAFLNSWWALIASPFTFFIAFTILELLGSFFGFDSETAPPNVIQTIGITALSFLLMLPTPVLSLKWGLQARKAGIKSANIPTVLAGIYIAAIVFMFLSSAIVMHFA